MGQGFSILGLIFVQQQIDAIQDSLRKQVRHWHERLLPDWSTLGPKLVELVIILFLTWVAYRLTRAVLGRIITREVEDDDPITKRLKQQRVQTVAALVTNVVMVVFVLIAVLTVLDTVFNVKIGPILATAGVLGLAVSFGAQSLVKDVISGTFMLLEGQFGIGDVVKVGDVSGLVEKITLRTTVLRDVHGTVHIIPNGEITRVSNMTKAWSRAVLDITIPYDQDSDRVVTVLRDEGERLRTDEEWGQLLLEPPEVLGIDAFAEAGMVIRMIAKTLPLKQWDVARELRRRIKKRFDAEHIEIAFPRMMLNWRDGQEPASPSGQNVNS